MKFPAYLQKLGALYASRDLALKLGKPAATKTLERLEKTYGFSLPAEVRSAFLVTDGVPGARPFFARPGFLTPYGFLSVAGSLKAREDMRKRAPQYRDYVQPTPRDARINPAWFCEGWLPFADFGGGSSLLILDCAPERKGNVGQIIAYSHDPDELAYVAKWFELFLSASLKAAQSDPDEFLQLF